MSASEPHALRRLIELAEADPARLLLDAGGRQWSAGELWSAAQATAAALRAHAGPGEAVALLCDSHDACFVGIFAVWLLGGVAVPLNTTLPAPSIADLLQRSHAVAAIVDGERDTVELGLPCQPLVRTGAGVDPRAVLDREEERALIIFTSGTTGLPKGVCQTLRAVSTNARQTRETLGLGPADRIYINTPPYYTSALIHFLTLLDAGGSLVGRRGFQFGADLLDELVATGCTGFGGAPAHVTRVVAPLEDPARPAGLRFWVSSGDHLPQSSIAALRRLLPDVGLFVIYGLTEVSGRMCILGPDALDARPGSVGRPIPALRVTVRDEAGAELPAGETGELYVTGSLLMEGYLDMPVETSRALTPLGFRTGDLGRMDVDGYVWHEGRNDCVFKRGGEKVSTRHIERCLREEADVRDVAVLAVEDALAGRVPVAFVVPGNPQVRRRDIVRALRRVLPPASWPADTILLDAIPRTGSGKAIAAELRRHLPPGRP